MLENRNCIGQLVNDDTLDGDRDIGTAKTGSGAGAPTGSSTTASTSVIVDGGCDRRAERAQPAASAISPAMPEGSTNGSK